MIRRKKKKKTQWMSAAVKHPGALHRALGVTSAKTIPASMLEIKPTDSTLMKRRKNYAKVARAITRKRAR